MALFRNCAVLFLLFFSEILFAKQPLQIEWQDLYRVQMKPGIFDNSDNMFNLPRRTDLDFLMIQFEDRCRIQVESLYADFVSVPAGQFFDDNWVFIFMRFPQRAVISRFGFRSFMPHGLQTGHCFVNFFYDFVIKCMIPFCLPRSLPPT
jgi:hypothetical protein